MTTSRTNLLRFLSKSYYIRKCFALQSLTGIPLTKDGWALIKLKNTAPCSTCFIVGNGPSLTLDDLQKIRWLPSFGSNRIYLAFEHTDWRPTYYMVCDPQVLAASHDSIKNHISMPAFCPINSPGRDLKNLIKFYAQFRLLKYEKNAFSTTPLKHLTMSGTVCFPMIQLAYYMGFRSFVLLGVDFSYESTKVNTLTGYSSHQLKAKTTCDHFTKDYYKPGELWIPPDLEQQRMAFFQARQFLEMRDGSILNASRVTQLDIIPRVELDSILENLAS